MSRYVLAQGTGQLCWGLDCSGTIALDGCAGALISGAIALAVVLRLRLVGLLHGYIVVLGP